MLTQEQRLERSSRAAVELSMTEEAFAELRLKIIEKWAATTTDQVETREKLFMAVHALDVVKKALIRVAADGQVLQHSAEVAELLAPALADRAR
jgi:hypothetical protein